MTRSTATRPPDGPGDQRHTDPVTESPRAPQPTAENLAEPLRSRWSPSVFDAEHHLDAEQVETLLRAAQWAPSGGNFQPWTFFVCERGSANHERLVATLSRGNSGWVPRASVVFVTATLTNPAPDDPRAKMSDYAKYDLGQAAAHLTLQARAMGLHAHQFAGFDHAALAEALELPDTHSLMTGIAVGIPGDPAEVSERDAERDHRPRKRHELSEWAYGDVWGRPWRGE